jgi:hypothetical protein
VHYKNATAVTRELYTILEGSAKEIFSLELRLITDFKLYSVETASASVICCKQQDGLP